MNQHKKLLKIEIKEVTERRERKRGKRYLNKGEYDTGDGVEVL